MVEGRSFDLVTSQLPATTFRFQCTVSPDESGSRTRRGVSMSGLLGPLLAPPMGNRIASGFEKILDGLAWEAERGS